MSNFLFMTSENNWKIILKEYIMGLGRRWGTNLFQRLRTGDNCIIYITRISVFSGAFKIISKDLNNKIKWNNGDHKFLFRLEPLIIPKTPIPVKAHINKLKFIKNRNKWFIHFRAPKQISDEDFEYILDQMRR